MKLEVFGKSDVGRIRSNNEDAFKIDEKIGLMVVADGMGGHSAGEVASKMAVETIVESMRRFVIHGEVAILGKVNPDFSERTNQLASSIRLSNQIIYESAKAKPQYQGMGTTVDSVWVGKEKISIAHVGDSRVYLVRVGKINPLTRDHSLVAEQEAKGLITREEAEKSEIKNILTRAVGVAENVEVDMLETEWYDGDILIVCTDGLCRMVSDEQILETVFKMKNPKMTAEHLIDMANVAGGLDNTTVIAAHLKK